MLRLFFFLTLPRTYLSRCEHTNPALYANYIVTVYSQHNLNHIDHLLRASTTSRPI